MVDLKDELQLTELAKQITTEYKLDLVFVETGTLYDEHIQPEKSLCQLTASNFDKVFFAGL